MKRLPQEWFAGDAPDIAPELLGKMLRFRSPGGVCTGRIVETEAYTTDPASHGRVITQRSRPMRETYGHWYVYISYGVHHCLNTTTNKAGTGGVLIRALEPLEGIPLMEQRRGVAGLYTLCSGPGKLTQALGISLKENGLPHSDDFGIFDAPAVPPSQIVAGPRIGVSAGLELPWRFTIKDSAFVSGRRVSRK